jgi:type III pantothenate kinase
VNANLVADVGNTRIKWGFCAQVNGKLAVIRRATLADEPGAWEEQKARWNEEYHLWKIGGAVQWAVAGVHPERCQRLREWVAARGDRVVVLDKAAQLPLKVAVEQPDRVGLDRLLNAVAAQKELLPAQPAVLIDAGSAVTVDWLDEQHVFRGGAIFPGVRLMAKALHDYTALLPEVEVGPTVPPLPGKATAEAMQAGVYWAVLGGVEAITRRLARGAAVPPHLFLTGGDAEWLVEALDETDSPPWLDGFAKTLWPEQTLEGILLSAEALPS